MNTKATVETYPMISLFSGAMGLDLGMERAGFETKVAVENDADAVKTMNHNRPSMPVIDKSIVDTTGAEIRTAAGMADKDIPLVVGGPPCQAFSVIGRRKGLDDARGSMLHEFHRIIAELRPHAFVMENVRGLLSMPIKPKTDPQATSAEHEKGSLLNMLMGMFEDIGYRVDCFVVNAVNYGAPQLRERLILIGNRHGKLATFPEPMYSNRPEDGLPPFKTLGHAIGGDFVDPDPEILDFSPRKLKYLSMVPPGGNWRSLPEEIQKESMGKTWHLKGGRSAYWRRLSFGYPSPTVVTMPNHAGTSMCHPTETRAISVGEAAAIQEFPAHWTFQGTVQSKFRQVGNAVPTRLGEITGGVVRSLLEQMDSSDVNETPKESRIVHIRPHVRTRSYWKSGQALAGDADYYKPVIAQTTNRA